MTETQLAQIRYYLLDKKLPIDILLEVQDHFVSQINDLERDENLDFDKALEQTKTSWQKELKPYWNGSWDLEDRSKFLREINRANFKSLIKKSLLYSTSSILVLVILSRLLDYSVYKYIFVLIVGFISLVPFINYIRKFKDFRLAKKYQQYILISIQEYTILNLAGSYFIFKFFIEGFVVAKMFSQFSMERDTKLFLFGVIITSVLIMVSFIALFSQKIYLSKIEKVKPFLKYLKPTS